MFMKTTRMTMMAALLLVSGVATAQGAWPEVATPAAVSKDAPAAAASASADEPLVNQVDVGVRGTVFGEGSDQARFERYRDLRNGPTLDRLRVFKDTTTYRYRVQ